MLEDKYFVLEPTPDRSDGTHWIYSAEHLHFSSGTCGHGFNISSSSDADGTSEARSPFRSFSSRVRVTSNDESFSVSLAGPAVPGVKCLVASVWCCGVDDAQSNQNFNGLICCLMAVIAGGELKKNTNITVLPIVPSA